MSSGPCAGFTVVGGLLSGVSSPPHRVELAPLLSCPCTIYQRVWQVPLLSHHLWYWEIWWDSLPRAVWRSTGSRPQDHWNNTLPFCLISFSIFCHVNIMGQNNIRHQALISENNSVLLKWQPHHSFSQSPQGKKDYNSSLLIPMVLEEPMTSSHALIQLW